MRARIPACSLVSLLLIAGCTTTTAGNAVSPTNSADQTPTSGPSSDELPRNGAPKVEDPLDTQQFQEKPCLLLSSSQSSDLDLGASGTPSTSPFGNECNWKNDTTGSGVEIIMLDKNPIGLSGAYGAEKDGEVKVFEELPPIEGYPAVIRMSADIRDLGSCTIVVGASDEIAVNISLQLSRVNVGKKDPCEVTARVTGLAVETIKQGQ